MPIYEYECTKCGNIEEALQKFSDKPLTRCGHCKGKLTKLVSQSTFHLKGSGWYVTDYANKTKDSTKDSAKDSTKDSAKDSTKDSAKDSAKDFAKDSVKDFAKPSKKETQSKSAESKTSTSGSENRKAVSEKSA